MALQRFDLEYMGGKQLVWAEKSIAICRKSAVRVMRSRQEPHGFTLYPNETLGGFTKVLEQTGKLIA